MDWQSCNGNFQCAILDVPIDHSDESLGTIGIAVVRYRDANQHDRIGSLVLNPGGPGVSGVEYAISAKYIVNPDVLERFDIVGFDPRGVGASAPIACLSDEEQDAIFASDPKPDNDAEYAQVLIDSEKFVSKCISKSEKLQYFSTQDAAKDMELLRKALGDAKLNYMGASYGTYLGTLYAKQFPEKVGRFVLDGAIDPTISRDKQSLLQAIAFDRALANFIEDCPKHSACPLPVDANKEFFIQLFADVSRTPLVTGERLIGESLVVIGTASALYDDSSGWPILRTAIAQAQSGNGAGFAKLADDYNGRRGDGSFMNNQNSSNPIIDCLDWPSVGDNESIRASAENFSTAAPVFGPYLAYGSITCNFLYAAIDRQKNTTALDEPIEFTFTPVLIIGTTGDPATPYTWAKALNRYIKSSRLITMVGDGHTAYGRGSACIDDAVDRYLKTGKLPANKLTCKA